MLRLLLVEDHPLVREAMVGILSQLGDSVEVTQAGTCQDALVSLAANEDVDLIVVDLALPGLDGFSFMEILRQEHKSLPVVVISAYDDAGSIKRAFELGASGFIPKTYPSDQVLAILRRILEGKIFRPDGGTVAEIQHGAPVEELPSLENIRELGLTERQAEVLAQVVLGKSNREIGQALGISEGTVKIHITAVFKSLGVTSRTQALVVVSKLNRQEA